MASGASVEGIERAARVIDPVFRDTPQFASEALGVVLKVETVNPIRSFKGRGTDYLVSQVLAERLPLVCASAGNFGQGLAYAARKRRLPVVIFAAESANPLKVEQMRRLGADVRLAGVDFDSAKEYARAWAADNDARFIEDGREPQVAEGAGTIARELCRDGPFDAVLVPLGNGALVLGIGLWMKGQAPGTRVFAVCAAGAPAMALSWREGRPIETAGVDTIADGIAVRVPVPEIVPELRQVVDDVLLVNDEELIEAMRAVFREHGLLVEPAGVAGLAAAMRYAGQFAGARIVTPLCGGNLTARQIRDWLS